ncbi:MAG TPA: extracellular solute-binding protein [Roseiflexaceae bacterium]|nr:extracellular solute-binding protein [Roseiflexaceae bacterium]
MQPFRRILVLLVAALLAGACSGGEPPAPDAAREGAPAAEQPSPDGTPAGGEPVTITFAGQGWERSAVQPLIERFQSENPDVRVRFVPLESVYTMGTTSNPEEELRQIAGAVDTAVAYSITRGAVQAGYMLDLAPLIAADESFDREDFYPGALESVSSESATYMVPRSISFPLLRYNKELWDRAALAAPGQDWTWEDLAQAAEQLARRRGDTVEVYGMTDWTGFAVVDGLLGRSVGLGGLDTLARQGRFDQPELLAALERLDTLVRSSALFVPQNVNGEYRSPEDKIRNGEIGIWPNGMSEGNPGDRLPFAVGTLPLPGGASGTQGFAQGYVISGGTQHPEAAWRWLSFLSRQQIERPASMPEDRTTVPARRSIAERSGFWNTLDAETRTAIETTLGRPAVPTLRAVDQAYRNALVAATDRVVSGEQTPEQALAEALASYEQALAETKPTETPGVPLAVATPAPEQAAPEGAVTVRFDTFGLDVAEMRRLADAFNRSQSEVFVELVESDIQGLSLLRMAETSDAFVWYGLPSADEQRALLDLQPLVDADPDFGPHDYPSALLATFRQDGRLLGLPHSLELPVVQYDPALFEQAGLEPPASDWTLDQYIDAAQRLTKGEERDRQYGFGADGPLGLQFVLDAMGVSLTTGQGEQARPTYTDPKVLEATRRFVDLILSSSPKKELDGYRGTVTLSTFELVQQGRLAMWVSYELPGALLGGVPPEAGVAAPPKTGIAAPPLPPTGLNPNSFGVRGLYISANATDPQAVWRWVKFLSRSSGALYGRFPARSSVAQSEEFLRGLPEGAAGVYRAYSAALEQSPDAARSRPAPGGHETYWYYRAVDRVLRGEERDLERALADAQNLAEEFLSCTRAGGAPATCAKQADPTYDGSLSDARGS